MWKIFHCFPEIHKNWGGQQTRVVHLKNIMPQEWLVVIKLMLTLADLFSHRIVIMVLFVSALTFACSWAIWPLPAPVGKAAKSPVPHTQKVPCWTFQHHHWTKLFQQPTREQAVGHVLWQRSFNVGAVDCWKREFNQIIVNKSFSWSFQDSFVSLNIWYGFSLQHQATPIIYKI